MFNLIVKDFLVQKKSVLFSFGYCIFVLLFFSHNQALNNSIYIMAAAAVSYMLLQGAAYADEKNASAIILNSLPLSRKNLVLAKYLTLVAYLAMGLTFSGIIGFILPITINFPVRPITVADVTVSIISVGIMASIYLPLFFKFGNNIIRLVNVALFMLTFFVPGIIIAQLKNQPSGFLGQLIDVLRNLPGWLVTLGALTITGIVLSVSMAISLRIYNNKDLC